MAIADDWTIDYANKTVKHTSGSTIYSVNALYTYLQDDFDELNQLDDSVPMSAQTPTQYTMINGWFLSPDSIPYLDSGSIATNGYTNEIHLITFGGTYTNAVAGDIGKTVTDDSVDFGTLIHYDNTAKKWWVRTGSATIAASGSTMAITSGTGTGVSNADSLTGEDLFPNVYTLGSIESGTTIYIEQNDSVVTSWWSTGHIDILLQVKESGVEIDGANITVFARNYGNTFDHFDIDLSTGGRNAVPLATAVDLNNTTAAATIEDYQDGTIATVAITYGNFTADIDIDGTDENYGAQIDCDGVSIDKVYEVCKWWTQGTSTKDLDGTAGKIYVSVEPGSYTPVKASPLGTFAGGKFFGAKGVYLINVAAADAQNYQLIDEDDNTITPPNYQAFIVNSVVSGDRVAIFPASGGVVNKAQSASHATLNVLSNNEFVGGTSFPVDTPAAGTLIVVATDEEEEHVYRYTSITGSTMAFPTPISSTATGGDTTTLTDSGQTFLSSSVQAGDLVYDTTNGEIAYVVTVDSDTQLTTTSKATSWSGANYVTHNLVQTYDASDTIYVPYIYRTADATTESETVVYLQDRPVITRVRKKGILPFEVAGTFTSSGLTVTAIRTTDSIVS